MKIYRARLFTPVSDPFTTSASASFVAHDDGFIAVDGGRITGIGEWDRHPEGDVIDLGRKALISPGFIDTHLHAPQLEMIGSYGGHLLEWLNRYTFPTEAKFADPNMRAAWPRRSSPSCCATERFARSSSRRFTLRRRTSSSRKQRTADSAESSARR